VAMLNYACEAVAADKGWQRLTDVFMEVTVVKMTRAVRQS